MYKKTWTYTDYNGVTKTEDFYFNLNKVELADMQMSSEGSLDEIIDRITKAQETPLIWKYFKKLMLAAYGEKTSDGRFVKTDEILAKFQSTVAFSEIAMLFATNDKEASDFVNGILPKEVAEQKQNVVTLPLK